MRCMLIVKATGDTGAFAMPTGEGLHPGPRGVRFTDAMRGREASLRAQPGNRQ